MQLLFFYLIYSTISGAVGTFYVELLRHTWSYGIYMLYC